MGLVWRVADGRTEDLHGHLNGDVELVLALVLEHQRDQRGGLVAGTAAGAAQHGLGQLVQAELVHLAGQADLGVGIQPQAEEPLGGLSGAIQIAREDREPHRQFLAALHGGVVHRLNGIGQHQRVVPLPLLLQQFGQLEPEIGLGPRRLGDPVNSAIASSLSSFHQRMVAEAQPRIEGVGGRRRPLRPGCGSGRPGRSERRRSGSARRPCVGPESRSRRDIRSGAGNQPACIGSLADPDLIPGHVTRPVGGESARSARRRRRGLVAPGGAAAARSWSRSSRMSPYSFRSARSPCPGEAPARSAEVKRAV